LRWRVGERWIELAKMGDPYPIEWLDREELIILAESLVLQPDDRLAGLNPDHLTCIEDAEKLASFDIKEPALLPDGFAFTYAQWVADAQFVKLVYELGRKSGVAGIVIFQSRLTDVKAAEITPEVYPPGALEVVQVGGITGTYLAGSWWAAPMPDGTPTPGPTPTLAFRPDDPTRSLAWKADGLDIQILYYAGTNYGGRLDKEAMIRIAESMR
jgi:hypothetical protein